MDHENQLMAKEVEEIITKFLNQFEKGTIDDIYTNCRNAIPFFLLKDVIFQMFKQHKLRRRRGLKDTTEYRLTSMFPDFGCSYRPRKPYSPKKKDEKKSKKRPVTESCRDNSVVYHFDQLLRKTRL